MRRSADRSKKAPWVGAFFVLLTCWQPAVAIPCSPPAESEAVQVRYISDGDTLVLSDNKTIRLIGINAPETARDGRPAETLAIRARDRLRQLLFGQGNRARALFGEDAADQYGRSLAHLWLPDGRNLSAEMLREGMGWAIAIPPNTRFLDCYLAAEQQARRSARGVWAHPDHAFKTSTQLNLRSRGFQRVRGRIVRVNRGGGATWINLEGRFAVRIPDEDLRWFEQPPSGAWIGKRLEVRGWLYAAKGELRMTVRHPAALQLSPDTAADRTSVR